MTAPERPPSQMGPLYRNPPAWPIGAFVAGAIAVIAWVVWVALKDPPPIVLPPAVVTAVDSERADRARVDLLLRSLQDSARRLEAMKTAAVRRSDSLQTAAERIGRHADALADSARAWGDPSAAANAWRLAFELRTVERDSLLTALAADRVALAAADERSARLEAAARVADSARARADSVIDAVVTSVRRSTCTVPLTFGRVVCPSRRSAALVAGGIGLVAGTWIRFR